MWSIIAQHTYLLHNFHTNICPQARIGSWEQKRLQLYSYHNKDDDEGGNNIHTFPELYWETAKFASSRISTLLEFGMFLGAPTIVLSAARLLLLCSNNNNSTKLMMMLNIRVAFFIMEDPSCSSSTTLLKTNNPTLQDLLNKTS
jgi:hypothetical protein